MKNIKAVVLVVGMVVAGLFFASPTFATNPYGINYTGGEPLSSSNVQIDSNLGLTPLVKYGGTKTITASNSDLWQKGYEKTEAGTCREIIYFKVWQNNQIGGDNFYFTISNEQYVIKVNIKNVVLDGVTDIASNNALVISVPPHGAIAVNNGNTIYSDGQCSNQVSGVRNFYPQDAGFVFVETEINLFNQSQEKVKSSNLYFGITDIDYAQSAKILNNDSLLKVGNMFALPGVVLQPTDSSLRNMFVASGNYIYSQYEGSSIISTNENTNIFAKVGSESQENGLRVVFGYETAAGSGVEYFAKQYLVKYVSDENGTISGITEEDIIAGNNPDGSTSKPNDGYKFDYWTVDKNVVLADGTKIKAGDRISPEQIKQVVVNEELVFTAHHVSNSGEEKAKSAVAAPDTGSYTGENNATVVGVSIIALVVGGLTVALLPKLLHKKISFEK